MSEEKSKIEDGFKDDVFEQKFGIYRSLMYYQKLMAFNKKLIYLFRSVAILSVILPLTIAVEHNSIFLLFVLVGFLLSFVSTNNYYFYKSQFEKFSILNNRINVINLTRDDLDRITADRSCFELYDREINLTLNDISRNEAVYFFGCDEGEIIDVPVWEYWLCYIIDVNAFKRKPRNKMK